MVPRLRGFKCCCMVLVERRRSWGSFKICPALVARVADSIFAVATAAHVVLTQCDGLKKTIQQPKLFSAVSLPSFGSGLPGWRWKTFYSSDEWITDSLLSVLLHLALLMRLEKSKWEAELEFLRNHLTGKTIFWEVNFPRNNFWQTNFWGANKTRGPWGKVLSGCEVYTPNKI